MGRVGERVAHVYIREGVGSELEVEGSVFAGVLVGDGIGNSRGIIGVGHHDVEGVRHRATFAIAGDHINGNVSHIAVGGRATESAVRRIEAQPSRQGTTTRKLSAVGQRVADIRVREGVGRELEAERRIFCGVLVRDCVSHRRCRVGVGHDDSIEREVGCVATGHSGIPVVSRSQVVDSAARGAGAILVGNQVQPGAVGGTQRQREARCTGDFHIGRISQCVGGVALSREGELARIDVIGRPRQRGEVCARDHQHSCGRVVGGAGDGRWDGLEVQVVNFKDQLGPREREARDALRRRIAGSIELDYETTISRCIGPYRFTPVVRQGDIGRRARAADGSTVTDHEADAREAEAAAVNRRDSDAGQPPLGAVVSSHVEDQLVVVASCRGNVERAPQHDLAAEGVASRQYIVEPVQIEGVTGKDLICGVVVVIFVKWNGYRMLLKLWQELRPTPNCQAEEANK